MFDGDDSVAVPGLAIFGAAVIGTPPVNTAGFWIEVDHITNDWTELKPTPAYTSYVGE